MPSLIPIRIQGNNQLEYYLTPLGFKFSSNSGKSLEHGDHLFEISDLIKQQKEILTKELEDLIDEKFPEAELETAQVEWEIPHFCPIINAGFWPVGFLILVLSASPDQIRPDS